MCVLALCLLPGYSNQLGNCNLPPSATPALPTCTHKTMKLRTRIGSSSPIKQVTQRYEESSDWSLSSPASESDKLVSSPRRVINRLSVASSSSSSSSSSPTPTRSSSPITESFSEEEEEDEKESLESPKFKTTGKRPFLVQDMTSTDNSDSDNETIESQDQEMIDIMTDQEGEENSEAFTFTITNEISDPSLQGLLDDDEIDLEEALMDDSDRKLYEMAFNRAELTSSSHQNTPISASDGMFKGNRIKSSTKYSQTTSTGRGKGKDLFSV